MIIIMDGRVLPGRGPPGHNEAAAVEVFLLLLRQKRGYQTLCRHRHRYRLLLLVLVVLVVVQ